MNRVLKKAVNRIKSTKGMSIGETLAATLILLMATSVLVVTISLGASHYIRSLSGSEANTLASTIESMITSELAYTTNIQVDDTGTVRKFQSQNYAVDESLSSFSLSDGKVMIGDLKLLGDKSYPNGLSVNSLEIQYDSGSYLFTITLSIGRGSTEYLNRTFNVINVNRTAAAIS